MLTVRFTDDEVASMDAKRGHLSRQEYLRDLVAEDSAFWMS